MSSKTRTNANFGIGLIVILVTFIIFFVGYTDNPKSTIDWLRLIFILISEIAFFGGTTAFLSKKYTSSQMLFMTGVISVLSLYFIATIVLSLLSNSIFHDNIRGFITTQTIILAIALITSITLYSSAINHNEYDNALINARVKMNQCEEFIFSLKTNAKFGEYSSLLNKVYEEIKYSDKTKSTEKDQIIYEKIEDLNNLLLNNEVESKSEDISNEVDNIVLLIKERNMSVLKMHQGGF